MKIEEIWRAWKTETELRSYLILFFISWNFYRAYESDAETLSFLLGLKLVHQGNTTYVWFPKDSWMKFLGALRDAGYPFVVVQDKEWTGNRKPLVKNDGTKSLNLPISSQIMQEFHQNIVKEIEKYVDGTLVSIPFKEFHETLTNLSDIIQKYEWYYNLIDPQIANNPEITIDLSQANTDLNILKGLM